MLRIVPLGVAPEHATSAARWVFQAFPHEFVGVAFETWLEVFGDAQARQVFLALENGDLLGTATLDSEDLPGFEHLSPWLASVCVRPDARGRGIAAALIAHIEGVAFGNGVQHLYLHTHDHSAYYQKRGWVVLETTEAWGKTTTVMTKDAPP